MRYLRVIGEYINIDETLKISVQPGEKDGSVNFTFKLTNGSEYTSTLVRKDTYIAEPLTVDNVRKALYRSLQEFGKGACVVDIADYIDEDEKEEEEE
ncbi:MAG: hypothetical protein IJZ38_09645 [Bacteroides sp.]|nr:hypothetical protein [Bacteroides sp.]